MAKSNSLSPRSGSAVLMRVVFIGPAVAMVALLMVVPITYGLWMSFTNYNISRPASNLRFVGFSNYADVVRDPYFLSTVQWTLIFSAAAVLLSVSIGLLLALMLNGKMAKRSSDTFKIFFILPMMIAPVVAASIWYIIYAPIYGVFNAFLSTMNLPAVSWFGEVVPARLSIILVEVWMSTPFCMLVLLAALKGISQDMYEAADIEGAGAFYTFFKITLPMIRNFISLVVSIRIMDSLRVFDTVYNLTKGGPDISTETMGTFIYRTAFKYFDIGHGSAGAFLLFLFIAAVTALNMRLSRKDPDLV